MTFRFDLHVHTRHSKDARGSVLDLAEAAAAKGLHGFCITDHDTVRGHDEIADAMQATGLLILPGVEVTSAEGHILAIGCRHPIPKGLGVSETAAFIDQHDGVAVAAHPLRFLSGIGPTALQRHAEAGALCAVEGINARERRIVGENMMRRASELGLACIGGSDAHWIKDIGNAFTTFEERPADAAQVVAWIRDGLCRPGGGPTPRRSVVGHQLSLAVPPLRRRFVKH